MSRRTWFLKFQGAVCAVVVVGLWLLAYLAPQHLRAAEFSCPGNATIPIGPSPFTGLPASLTVREGGPGVTYTIALCDQPTEPVIVSMIVDEEQQLEVAPELLTFELSAWDEPQVVTVTAVDDSLDEMYIHSVVIEHSATSDDPRFDLLRNELRRINVAIIDNDTSRFVQPLIFREQAQSAEWSKVTATAGRDVDVLAIQTNRLFVGDRTDDANKGLYTLGSCNAEASYVPLITDLSVRDLAFSGEYALAAINGSAVYTATPPFEQWSRTPANINRFAFAVAIIAPNLAYAGTDAGVYVSRDQGRTWSDELLPNGPRLLNALRYDANSDTLWIATFRGGPWKLANGQLQRHVDGLSSPNNPGQDWDVWDILTVHGNNAGGVYLATTAGVFKSNGEDAWVRFGNEMQDKQVLSLEITPAESGRHYLYAGTLSDGLWRTVIPPAESQQVWIKVSDFQPATVRDLIYDRTLLCSRVRNALLAATDDGVWIYR